MTLLISADDLLPISQVDSSTYEFSIDDLHNGKVYRCETDLCDGLSILLDDYQLKNDLLIEFPTSSLEDQAILELSFSLLGTNHAEEVRPGQNFFSGCWSSDEGGTRRWHKGDRVLKFDIHFDAVFFYRLVGDYFSTLPSELIQALQQPSDREFWHLDKTTPAMHSTLRQILNCPYQGATRKLYLEAKAIELIAFRLATLTETLAPEQSSPLNPDDVDRLYWARDILVEQLYDPPSLLELARQVGLNDYKLKLGFRELFGTTVLGYVQGKRMELAKSLLLDSAMKVKDVAQLVGYKKPSQFAELFKRRFGISPKEYQQHELSADPDLG